MLAHQNHSPTPYELMLNCIIIWITPINALNLFDFQANTAFGLSINQGGGNIASGRRNTLCSSDYIVVSAFGNIAQPI